ncbi:MAG: DUF2975 domain-containing protein [Clostridia bacterium]|nr:DUF2975 domain-containing protein [Clostridia bacterium]
MEKIQKTSSVIGKILSVLHGIVFGVGCAVVVFMVLAAFVPLEKIMDVSSVTLELGSVELGIHPDYLPETTRLYVELMLAQALVQAGFTWAVLGILGKIFRPMSDGRPFDASVSGALRKLAWTVLGFGIGGGILESVVRTLQFTAFDVTSLLMSEKITSCTLVTEMDTGFIGMFAVLLLLSHVFRYGEELQQLSDETL